MNEWGGTRAFEGAGVKTLTQELRDLIAAKEAVVVAGCGVSVAATGGCEPAAGWRGLIESGVAFYAEQMQDTSEWAARVLDLLELGDPRDLPGVAQLVTDRMGGPTKWCFGKWMRETVGSLTVHDSDVIEALLALRLPILTTNYDTLIESVAGVGAVTWRKPLAMSDVISGKAPGVVHLHGVHSEPEDVVFAPMSYQRLLGDEAVQTLQKSVTVSRSLVFVGVGDGVSDANVGGLLKWFRTTFPAWSRQHYHLCLDDEVEAVRARYGEAPVIVLPYGRDYKELPTFLDRLAPEAPEVHDAEPAPIRVPRRRPRTDVVPRFRADVTGPWTGAVVEGGIRLFHVHEHRLREHGVEGVPPRLAVDTVVMADDVVDLLVGSTADMVQVAMARLGRKPIVRPAVAAPPVPGWRLLGARGAGDVVVVVGSCDRGTVEFGVGPDGGVFGLRKLHEQRSRSWATLAGGALFVSDDGGIHGPQPWVHGVLPLDGWSNVDAASAGGVTLVAGVRVTRSATELHVVRVEHDVAAHAVVPVGPSASRAQVPPGSAAVGPPSTVLLGMHDCVVGWEWDDLMPSSRASIGAPA